MLTRWGPVTRDPVLHEREGVLVLGFHALEGVVVALLDEVDGARWYVDGQLVKTVAKEAIELTDAWQYTKEKEYVEVAKKEGLTVTFPDTAPFKKASEKVYAKWFKDHPKWKTWYDEIQYLDPGARMPDASK